MKTSGNPYPIRYSNCWEDADLLLEAVRPKDEQRILCIASAGDNALALLSQSQPVINAFDLNGAQLALTELKQMAFLVLDHDEILRLLGVANGKGNDRLHLYEPVRQKLSVTSRSFWDEHIKLLEKGIIHTGKFEVYFQKFRRYFLPLVHNRREVDLLLTPKENTEQAKFYDLHWNNRRWQWLMQLFFSRFVMGKYGRDPQYLEHVTIPVAKYIRQRAEDHLRSPAASQNYFLHQIMKGQFGPQLPVYLRKENFESIHRNVYSLSLTQSSAATEVMKKSYDAYCLSNIFEYVSAGDFEKLCKEWSGNIPGGAVLVYWNLMVKRSFSEILPSLFQETKVKGAKGDKGFFYSRFLREEKI